MKKIPLLFLTLCIILASPTVMVKATTIQDQTYTSFNCITKEEEIFSTDTWNTVYETKGYPGDGFSENELQTQQIIGQNNLAKVENTLVGKNYRAAAFLEMSFPNSTKPTASAIMIGPSTALTAAHCVYNKASGGFATSIFISPARNLNKCPYGKTTITKISIPNAYKTSPTVGNDIAVINLKDPLGKKSGYLGCKVAAPKDLLDHYNHEIEYMGYPGKGYKDLLGNVTRLGEQWTMGGDCTYASGKIMRYNLDSLPGISGAGIILAPSSVVGVHNGSPKNNKTYNHGTRIDEEYLKWIKGLIK